MKTNVTTLKKIALPLIVTLCSHIAMAAGADGSGGGLVIQCGEQRWPWQDSPPVYLADTYAMATNGTFALKNQQEDFPKSVFLNAMFAALNANTDGLGDAVRERLHSLHFLQSPKPIALLNDDHFVIPENCAKGKKLQLAVQDLATGIVNYDANLLGQLTPTEQAYFEVHESLVSFRNSPGDTTPIRRNVLSAAKKINEQQLVRQVLTANFIESSRAMKFQAIEKVFLLEIAPAAEVDANIDEMANKFLLTNTREYWNRLDYGDHKNLETFNLMVHINYNQFNASAYKDAALGIFNKIAKHENFVDIAKELVPAYGGSSHYIKVSDLTIDVLDKERKLSQYLAAKIASLGPQYIDFANSLIDDSARFNADVCNKRPDLCARD